MTNHQKQLFSSDQQGPQCFNKSVIAKTNYMENLTKKTTTYLKMDQDKTKSEQADKLDL